MHLVMPLRDSITDAIGAATICLVALLLFLGLFCIIYSFYFRTQISNHFFLQLSYFNGPWIIRSTYILLAICCAVGEVSRLTFLRGDGRPLTLLSTRSQQTICKFYIVSNLGFSEPCLFLALVFLLRAPLQRVESGALSQNWNGKTAIYIFLYCLPLFILQLLVISAEKEENSISLPSYFTRASVLSATMGRPVCTYPLLSVSMLGVFSVTLIMYLFWLGKRLMEQVINRSLQRRVYVLIFSVSCFFPMRLCLLGLTVMARPGHLMFEILTFVSFLALFFCTVLGICVLAYYPVADTLVLRSLMTDGEFIGRVSSSSRGQNDAIFPLSSHS